LPRLCADDDDELPATMKISASGMSVLKVTSYDGAGLGGLGCTLRPGGAGVLGSASVGTAFLSSTSPAMFGFGVCCAAAETKSASTAQATAAAASRGRVARSIFALFIKRLRATFAAPAARRGRRPLLYQVYR
jgi:hypothetical protein